MLLTPCPDICSLFVCCSASLAMEALVGCESLLDTFETLVCGDGGRRACCWDGEWTGVGSPEDV